MTREQPKTFTIWSPKYALSEGVVEYTVRTSEVSEQMVCEVNHDLGPGAFTHNFHGEGREWCRTREEACKVAESMRIRKIASLKKQIAKLEAMKFQ